MLLLGVVFHPLLLNQNPKPWMPVDRYPVSLVDGDMTKSGKSAKQAPRGGRIPQHAGI